jgi:hypothetical protein
MFSLTMALMPALCLFLLGLALWRTHGSPLSFLGHEMKLFTNIGGHEYHTHMQVYKSVKISGTQK